MEENKILEQGFDDPGRQVIKREIVHFTKAPEIQHFAEVKVGQNDNVYGVTWADVVKEYLRTAYSGEEAHAEVESFGKTYKVLRRTGVTVFYDNDGNAIFDVTNERLADEYEWITRNPVSETPDEENGEAEKEVSQGEQEENGEVHTEVDGAVEENTQKSSVYIGVVGAVTKLQEELKKAKEKDFAKPVIEHLIERCKDSESLSSDVCQDHKTWEKCYKYIYDQARKQIKGSSGAVRDDVVYEWAEDYYHKDDKAEEEKKAKEAAEKKKKEAEKKKKKAAKAKPKTTEKKPAKPVEEKVQEVQKPKPQPKKNNKDMDGQMDLFSLMGM